VRPCIDASCGPVIEMTSRRKLWSSINFGEFYGLGNRQYDKRGGKRIIRELKILVFGDEHLRLTKSVCDRFFNNPRIFGYRSDE
jgi:hypothetical protein